MAEKHTNMADRLQSAIHQGTNEVPTAGEATSGGTSGTTSGTRDNPRLCGDDIGLLHLGQLLPRLRLQLDIGPELSDEDIMSSLESITARGDTRARWLTAFNSPLGHWLALRGTDLNTSLNLVLATLPPARS